MFLLGARDDPDATSGITPRTGGLDPVFHLFAGLDGVIQVFEQEYQQNAPDQTHADSDGQIIGQIGSEDWV